MFDAFKGLFSPQKSGPSGQRHTIEVCPDCGAQSGELHDLFCLKERCPFCNGQLATCECKRGVLKLSDTEQQALDEYIDDSVPPLSGIMQRWREALARKGRIPFEAYRDEPLRAAYRGDVEAVRQFIEDGFQVNAGNEVGYTALMASARGSSLDMIQFLLAQGAQPGLADKSGYTAVHWVVGQPTGDSARQAACLRALLDAGAIPNVQNQNGITPLMNAAWFGGIDSVRELLLRGADPLARDSKNRIARDLAIERNHSDVVELLK